MINIEDGIGFIVSWSMVIILLLTPGCYQVVNAYDIDEAQEICKDKGGIVEMTVGFSGQELVTCKNNMRNLLHESP